MQSLDEALDWERESRSHSSRRPMVFVPAQSTSTPIAQEAKTPRMTGSEAAAAYGAIVGQTIPRIGDKLVCSLCEKPITDVESHERSIAHLLAAERQPLKVPTYYKVSGKGRTMLERNGWKEGMGLGSTEQGRAAPLRATEKQDRLGIGLKRKHEKKETPVPQEKLRGSSHVRRGKAYEAQKGQWQTVYGALSDLSGDPVI